MNKTPKTEWKQGGDEQRMMIWKVVAYDSFYGMCLAVSRNPDEFTPSDFMYIMPDDTDKNAPVTLTFQRRGHITAQIKCALTDSNAEILLLMPNILEWRNDQVNLFELHIKNDTVIFNYTTTEGGQKDFKFPLAGFKEKYLEQFI